MRTESGHHYDAVGICLACDRCADYKCCEQVLCDKRAFDLHSIQRTALQLVKEKNERQAEGVHPETLPDSGGS